MKVYLNSITGIPDAMVSMYMSKRSWTWEKELHIRELCNKVIDHNGVMRQDVDNDALIEYNEILRRLLGSGRKHFTMLRYIDISATVEGLHRAGQDDFDSHAKRLDNRIIRSSTRLAKFADEKSEWYADKIITTDEAIEYLGKDMPNKIFIDNNTYVRCINGYVREDLKDDKDTIRGLYMMSIPSNFIFKCNLAELPHIIRERDKNGTAHPELKLMIETLLALINREMPLIDRDYMYKVGQMEAIR